ARTSKTLRSQAASIKRRLISMRKRASKKNRRPGSAENTARNLIQEATSSTRRSVADVTGEYSALDYAISVGERELVDKFPRLASGRLKRVEEFCTNMDRVT